MRTLAVALIAAIAVSALGAQRKPDDEKPWKTDPYTKNDPVAMQLAGYLSFGPFTLGDRHDTKRVEEDLGQIPLIWVETPHFKIGSTLPPKGVPRDKHARKKYREELTRLKQKLPKLKTSPRSLDRWLRLHLFAMRLEELHAELSEMLGVTDESFPQPGQGGLVDGKYMGRGPHFGVKGKHVVLMFEKASTCGRYLATFAKTDPNVPGRWYYEETDAFLFATAEEYGDNAFRADRALHAHLVFNLTHCLLDAYKGYNYLVPSWWKEGPCHVLRRRASTEHNNFSQISDASGRAYSVYNWDVKVRQRLEHDLIRPLPELLEVYQCDGWTLVDHMACWSRIEFLLERDPKGIATLVDRMKGFVDERGVPPEKGALHARQRAAVAEAWGFEDAEALETEWAKWVRKNYKKK